MKHTLDKYPVKERYAMLIKGGGPVKFDDLKAGDEFYLFDVDEFVEHKGLVKWRATEDAKDGVILCEGFQ